MFRLWGKILADNRLLRDHVAEIDDTQDTRTHKIFRALEELSRVFDLPVPIWLESNIKDFRRTSKTRFTQDSFLEPVAFDCLEIQIIEED